MPDDEREELAVAEEEAPPAPVLEVGSEEATLASYKAEQAGDGFADEEGEEAPVAEEPASPPTASAPSAAPAPAPRPPTPPVVAPEVQVYIDRLEGQNRVAQGQEELRILQEVVGQYSERLQTEQDFTPDQAQAVAQQQGRQLYAQYQEAQFRQGQTNAAFAIGKEFGVDPQALMQLPTPQAMREVARSATERGQDAARIAALEKEVEGLKKPKAAPAQRFASTQVAARTTGSRADKLAAYADGHPLTEKELEGLFSN